MNKNRLKNDPSVILGEAKDLLLYSQEADSSGCALRMTTHLETDSKDEGH